MWIRNTAKTKIKFAAPVCELSLREDGSPPVRLIRESSPDSASSRAKLNHHRRTAHKAPRFPRARSVVRRASLGRLFGGGAQESASPFSLLHPPLIQRLASQGSCSQCMRSCATRVSSPRMWSTQGPSKSCSSAPPPPH